MKRPYLFFVILLGGVRLASCKSGTFSNPLGPETSGGLGGAAQDTTHPAPKIDSTKLRWYYTVGMVNQPMDGEIDFNGNPSPGQLIIAWETPNIKGGSYIV